MCVCGNFCLGGDFRTDCFGKSFHNDDDEIFDDKGASNYEA